MGGTGRARCGARSEERDLVRERYYEHRAPVYDVTSYRGDPEVDAGLDRETAAIGRILTSMASESIQLIESLFDIHYSTRVRTKPGNPLPDLKPSRH